MEIIQYSKKLLKEFRLVTYRKACGTPTDEQLAKAATLNRNLETLGYVLSPADLVAIAVSPSLDGLYDRVRRMSDRVRVCPMYPGFPKQVMEIDEAQFYFNQLEHYFSTYGLEDLLGVQVSRGWLPYDGEQKEAPREQEIVLPPRTLRLIPNEEMYRTPFFMVLSRRERMTLPEREMVAEAVEHVTREDAAELHVGFKENLNTLYGIIFEMEDREAAFEILRGLCQHTGDVLRCVEVLLRKYKYHLRTAQKRFLVRLLESYPFQDFKANLILSGKTADRNVLFLNYLDYSVYSRSAEHFAAVNDLRDGRLRSWTSVVEALLAAGDDNALDFIAARPGMMLRMVARLLRLGYSKEAITQKLSANAALLSVQTLVTNLNYFGKLNRAKREDAPVLCEIFETLLAARLRTADTTLRGKKVKLCMDDFNLECSELRCSDKSAEGGYIRSGLAYRIPEGVDAVRFFVYWNDKNRVDIDLHCGFTDKAGNFHWVGWNSSFRNTGVVFSGDITHSNAAEYIDVKMDAPIDKVYAIIHLFSGYGDFSKVETCFVGMMGVPNGSADGREEALYREANCFFGHDLRQECAAISYGYIDVPNRCLIFDGAPAKNTWNWYEGIDHTHGTFTLARYLELLLEGQEAVLTEDEAEADVILVMGKPLNGKDVSLVDANFFME